MPSWMPVFLKRETTPVQLFCAQPAGTKRRLYMFASVVAGPVVVCWLPVVVATSVMFGARPGAVAAL